MSGHLMSAHPVSELGVGRIHGTPAKRLQSVDGRWMEERRRLEKFKIREEKMVMVMTIGRLENHEFCHGRTINGDLCCLYDT